MTKTKKFKKPQNVLWRLYLDIAKKSERTDFRKLVERVGYVWQNFKQTYALLPIGKMPAELFKPVCAYFKINEEEILNPKNFDKYGNAIEK